MKKTLLLPVLLAIGVTLLPAAIITDTPGPFLRNQRIGFNTTCHDGALRPNCVWNWGDGTQTNVPSDSDLGWIDHAYQSPGTYLVRYFRSAFIAAAGAPKCGTVAAWSESLTITVTSIPDEVTVLLAEITLDNGRSYKVVPKNSRSLKGILRLKLRGTGIVSGYWLVDDQPLEFFEVVTHQGELQTIQTRAIPGLPTMQPGLHSLTVKLNRPLQEAIQFPVMNYFVLPDANQIVPVRPAEYFVAKETEKPEFSWKPARGASRYQIAFSNEPERLRLDTPPLVWIDTLDRTAMTPDDETWSNLLRNCPVYWQVRALDSLGNVLAESTARQFKIIVPGASLTFTSVTDLDGNPLTVTDQSVHQKNGPILVKGEIRCMSDAEYLILRVLVNHALSDQLVIRDYRLGENRSFETSLATGPGDTQVEFQVLRSSSPSVIIGSEHLLIIQGD